MLIEIKQFESMAGSEIRQCIEEAKVIAKNNHCFVRFEFNDVLIDIYWESDVKEEVDRYFREIRKEDTTKIKKKKEVLKK